VNVGDLLDRRVVDAGGAPVGYVTDVRLTLEVLDEGTADAGRDAPLAHTTRARVHVGSAVVLGLVVSPRTGASMLGYERTGVRAPWPLPQVVRRRHRGTFLVRWEDVVRVDDGTVHLAEGYVEHDAALADHQEPSPGR
jgi:hypothetical protein